MKKIITAESVTEGHPDKVCDAISDAVLDELIGQDKHSRVACETAATTGLVLVMGEITTNGYADIAKIARERIDKIGYNEESGFSARSCAVLLSLDEQSPDIAMGVDKALEEKLGQSNHDMGAGDQGMMYGFACRETEELMPLPIMLSHKLTRRLAQARKSGELKYLRPDGKAQVSVEYDGFTPVRVDSVVVSAQHNEQVDIEDLRADILEKIIKPIIPETLFANTRTLINPTGRFVVGGPHGDSGLTGRKIIVDTYGGYVRHGGGAFSGKDPSKVDRSATYYTRYAAKNIVAAGLAERCEIEISYAIGVARPVSLAVNTFGTGNVDDDTILSLLNKHFDFRPAAIVEQLDLLRPIYSSVSAYGHFGRSDLDLPWERTDRAGLLKNG